MEVRRLKELELQARELRVAALLEFGLHGEAPPIGSERARLRLLIPASPSVPRASDSFERAGTTHKGGYEHGPCRLLT